MKNNKEVLVIPKYKLPFENGLTIDESDLWIKYNNSMLFRDITKDCKLFYKLIPYLIIQYNDYHLVFKTDGGHYSFNSNGLVYIKSGIYYCDYIKSVVEYNANKCGMKNTNCIKDYGFIKSAYSKPDDIAITYKAKVDDYFSAPDNAEWMSYSDLVNKCRKFDSFGIEYIDYLISHKIK